MDAMTENDGRRWFRFRLRTVFVVVTLLCGWLGWEVSIVQQRKQVLIDLQANQSFQFWKVESTPHVPPPGSVGSHVAAIPLVRTWMGDVAVQRIYYISHYQGFSKAELARLAKIFPEAELFESQPEPCHPGCFPSGTLVGTPQGPRPIEGLQVGELITAVHSNGGIATAHIQSIFVTNNRLWKVQTDRGALLTTETQPLCVKVGTPGVRENCSRPTQFFYIRMETFGPHSCLKCRRPIGPRKYST